MPPSVITVSVFPVLRPLVWSLSMFPVLRPLVWSLSLCFQFYAPWCGHCRKLEPIYHSVWIQLRHTSIRVSKIDATRYANIASEFDVRGYPTIKLWVYCSGSPELNYFVKKCGMNGPRPNVSFFIVIIQHVHSSPLAIFFVTSDLQPLCYKFHYIFFSFLF